MPFRGLVLTLPSTGAPVMYAQLGWVRSLHGAAGSAAPSQLWPSGAAVSRHAARQQPVQSPGERTDTARPTLHALQLSVAHMFTPYPPLFTLVLGRVRFWATQARIESTLATGEARRSFTRSFKEGLRSAMLRLPSRKSRGANSASSMVVSPTTGRLGRARRKSFRVERPTSDASAFEYVAVACPQFAVTKVCDASTQRH